MLVGCVPWAGRHGAIACAGLRRQCMQHQRPEALLHGMLWLARMPDAPSAPPAGSPSPPLARFPACPPPPQLEFVRASSYGSGTSSSGSVRLSVDMAGGAGVAGRHVLLVGAGSRIRHLHRTWVRHGRSMGVALAG